MMRQRFRTISQWPGAAAARLRQTTSRAARFSGVYDSRAAALAVLPDAARAGYDNAEIADVSFDWMCQRAAWDYPVLYWLKTIAGEGATILDAGGHLGTKYIAFSGVWDMSRVNWVVYDTPGIIAAAQTRQQTGKLPAEITFTDELDVLPVCDVLLASGLIQYLDMPFADFLDRLPQKPSYILVNKLPLRDGDGFFTLERIGQARVPYQIRGKAEWAADLADLGYEVVDQWDIEGLSHSIATHPWLGRNASVGYCLRRVTG